MLFHILENPGCSVVIVRYIYSLDFFFDYYTNIGTTIHIESNSISYLICPLP